MKIRKCRLPSCGKSFEPEHTGHFFHHEFCFREALTQYTGSDFPLASDGSKLLAHDLYAGVWNPLYEYRIPGKRHTLDHRRKLTPKKMYKAVRTPTLK